MAFLFPRWAFRSNRSIYNTRMAYGHQQIPLRHPSPIRPVVFAGQVCLQSGLHPQEKPIGFGAFSCPSTACWLVPGLWLWNIRIIQMKYAPLLGSNQQPNCQQKWQEGKKNQHLTCSRWITWKICPAPHHYTWRGIFFFCVQKWRMLGNLRKHLRGITHSCGVTLKKCNNKFERFILHN